jgi:hypothetical protein
MVFVIDDGGGDHCVNSNCTATSGLGKATRDLNDLVKRNLVRQVEGGYVPNIEVVHGFLLLAATP